MKTKIITIAIIGMLLLIGSLSSTGMKEVVTQKSENLKPNLLKEGVRISSISKTKSLGLFSFLVKLSLQFKCFTLQVQDGQNIDYVPMPIIEAWGISYFFRHDIRLKVERSVPDDSSYDESFDDTYKTGILPQSFSVQYINGDTTNIYDMYWKVWAFVDGEELSYLHVKWDHLNDEYVQIK
jgi:hypothetical protein